MEDARKSTFHGSHKGLVASSRHHRANETSDKDRYLTKGEEDSDHAEARLERIQDEDSNRESEDAMTSDGEGDDDGEQEDKEELASPTSRATSRATDTATSRDSEDHDNDSEDNNDEPKAPVRTTSIAQVLEEVNGASNHTIKEIYEAEDFENLARDAIPVLESKLRFAREEYAKFEEVESVMREALKQSTREKMTLNAQHTRAKTAMMHFQRRRQVSVASVKRRILDSEKNLVKLEKQHDAVKAQAMLLSNQEAQEHSEMEAKLSDFKAQSEAAETTIRESKIHLSELSSAKTQALEDIAKGKATKLALERAIETKQAQARLSLIQNLNIKESRTKELLMQIAMKRATNKALRGADKSDSIDREVKRLK